jgi:hypothetical protein
MKNEAVGHSSLDLTKELIETFGLDVDAEKVHTTVSNGTHFIEGSPSQGVTIKFILDKGSVRVESTGVASGLQRESGGRKGAGRTGSGNVAGAAGASGANGQGVTSSTSRHPGAGCGLPRLNETVCRYTNIVREYNLPGCCWYSDLGYLNEQLL